MIRRRRRPHREVAFSFDSFLDVVANVVGIILRLILVAWVGARSYKAIVPPPPPPPAALADPAPLPEPTDPRQELLAQRRMEIDAARRSLEHRGRDHAQVESAGSRLRRDIEALVASRQKLEAEQAKVKQVATKTGTTVQTAKVNVENLQARSKKLLAELEKLRRLPSPRKELRYRTPISAPVTEEVMFECKHGRVTLIDTAALLAEIKRESRSKAEDLRSRWQVSDLTSPVGSFRLRYVIEREKGLLDGPAGAVPVDSTFRYGVTSWEVVPVAVVRGETAEAALQRGSAFRKVVDGIDAQQTAVTLWVYPDSFTLYRAIRDYLHEKNVVVAGRPLPDGAPIASSRQGSLSRGQ